MKNKTNKEQNAIPHDGEVGRCCICGRLFYGVGNNPDPVSKKGRCCDECDDVRVAPSRCGVSGFCPSNWTHAPRLRQDIVGGPQPASPYVRQVALAVLAKGLSTIPIPKCDESDFNRLRHEALEGALSIAGAVVVRMAEGIAPNGCMLKVSRADWHGRLFPRGGEVGSRVSEIAPSVMDAIRCGDDGFDDEAWEEMRSDCDVVASCYFPQILRLRDLELAEKLPAKEKSGAIWRYFQHVKDMTEDEMDNACCKDWDKAASILDKHLGTVRLIAGALAAGDEKCRYLYPSDLDWIKANVFDREAGKTSKPKAKKH